MRFLLVHYKRENKKEIRDKDALRESSRKINCARFNRWDCHSPDEPFDEIDDGSHYYYSCDFNACVLTYPSPLLSSVAFVPNGVDRQPVFRRLPALSMAALSGALSQFSEYLGLRVYLLINQLIQIVTTPGPIRESSTTMNVPSGSLKSTTSFPPTGGNPISTGASGGGAATKSGSTPTGGAGAAATKSGSPPTGSTGAATKSGRAPTSGTGATAKSDSIPTGGTSSTAKSDSRPTSSTSATAKSDSRPTGSTGATTKSGSTPAGGTGSGSGSGQCSQPSRPDARALASYSPVRPGQGG